MPRCSDVKNYANLWILRQVRLRLLDDKNNSSRQFSDTSRLSQTLPDCLRHFQTVSYTSRQFSNTSRQFSDTSRQFSYTSRLTHTLTDSDTSRLSQTPPDKSQTLPDSPQTLPDSPQTLPDCLRHFQTVSDTPRQFSNTSR